MAICHERSKLLHLRHLRPGTHSQGLQRLGVPTPAVMKIIVQKTVDLARSTNDRSP